MVIGNDLALDFESSGLLVGRCLYLFNLEGIQCLIMKPSSSQFHVNHVNSRENGYLTVIVRNTSVIDHLAGCLGEVGVSVVWEPVEKVSGELQSHIDRGSGDVWEVVVIEHKSVVNALTEGAHLICGGAWYNIRITFTGM